MRRAIFSLLLVAVFTCFLAAQSITFKVTVICPDANGLNPTTAIFTITAPNRQAAAGKAIALFKQNYPAHRNHKQGIYEITQGN